ncbi:hypothetical protein M0Q28_05670 [Patescibacteria group bacterium]|nr:hypothetical protein [Patescibacteria group bacterium]
MDFVDLKLPKKSAKGGPEAPACIGGEGRDQYPYGLRITLDEEQLAKMGELFDGVDADGEVTITAKGCVTSKRSDQMQGGKKNRGLSIQIQKINIACKTPYEKGSMDDFVKARTKK